MLVADLLAGESEWGDGQQVLRNERSSLGAQISVHSVYLRHQVRIYRNDALNCKLKAVRMLHPFLESTHFGWETVCF